MDGVVPWKNRNPGLPNAFPGERSVPFHPSNPCAAVVHKYSIPHEINALEKSHRQAMASFGPLSIAKTKVGSRPVLGGLHRTDGLIPRAA